MGGLLAGSISNPFVAAWVFVECPQSEMKGKLDLTLNNDIDLRLCLVGVYLRVGYCWPILREQNMTQVTPTRWTPVRQKTDQNSYITSWSAFQERVMSTSSPIFYYNTRLNGLSVNFFSWRFCETAPCRPRYIWFGVRLSVWLRCKKKYKKTFSFHHFISAIISISCSYFRWILIWNCILGMEFPSHAPF